MTISSNISTCRQWTTTEITDPGSVDKTRNRNQSIFNQSIINTLLWRRCILLHILKIMQIYSSRACFTHQIQIPSAWVEAPAFWDPEYVVLETEWMNVISLFTVLLMETWFTLCSIWKKLFSSSPFKTAFLLRKSWTVSGWGFCASEARQIMFFRFLFPFGLTG